MEKNDSGKDLIKTFPNFFCDMEVLNALISKERDRDDYGEVNFTIDIIDAPFMVLYKAEENTSTVKIYKRRDVYTHDESGYCIGTAILDKISGGVSMDFQNSLDPNRMGTFVVSCLKLNEYIQENNLSGMYDGLDAEKAGVLITQDEGKLACRVVSGKERPDIMCDTVLNGSQMCRPYIDEEDDDSPFGVFRNWVKKEEQYGQFVVNNELNNGNVTIRCVVTGTHHGGRADRIEYITVGDSLTLKREFDSQLTPDSIEVFNSSDESLGWIEVYMSDILAPLIDDEIVTIGNVTVASVIPKSQRGKRARAAEMFIDVAMTIDFDKINNESSNEESLTEDSLNEESLNEESLTEEGSNEESLTEEGLNEEDIAPEIPKKTDGDEQLATRSDLFVDMENQFKLATKDEIVAIAIASAQKIVEAFSDGEQGNQVSLMLLIFGAKLGLVGDGVINEVEKELVSRVFGPIVEGELSSVYDMIGNEIEESDYELVRVLTEMGNNVVIPFLQFILSFAYIDQVLEDEVAKRLDVLFGLNLLVDFMQSEQEDVLAEEAQPAEETRFAEETQPAEETRLVDETEPVEETRSAEETEAANLETAIVQWFQSDDRLWTLNDIVARFQDSSSDKVKDVLDRLCDKGILYGGDSIIRCMYGLVSSDETASAESLPVSKEENIQSREGYKVVKKEETITVNNDFTITLQEGMYYATPDTVELDEMAVLNIGRLKADKQDAEGYIRINVNKDADFFGTFFAKEFEPGQYEQVLEKFDFEKYLQEKTLQEPKESEEQINEWATAVRVKTDFYSTYKVYKNEENLKIGYYSNFVDGVPAYMIQIITRKSLYMCNSVFTAGVLAIGLREFLGDSVADDEKFLDGILNSITLVHAESDVSDTEKVQTESSATAEEDVKKQLDDNMRGVSYTRSSDRVREHLEEQAEKMKTDKEREKQSQYEQIDADTQRQKEEVINAKEQERKLIEEKKSRNRENLRLHRLELESLGAMRLLRRHSLEKMIREEESEDKEFDIEMQANQIRLKDELRALDQQAEEKKRDLLKELDEKYRIPKSPEVKKD